MKREDIIAMAREAGMEQDGDNFFSPSHEEIDVHITDLERFAALVAAAAIKDAPDYKMGYSDGMAAENEACAKFLESTQLGSLPEDTALHYARLLKGFADGIRARKEYT